MNDYLSMVREFYDLSNPDTLKKVVYCTEADKKEVISNVTTKLYLDMRDHVLDIDFGTIPLSNGDITKIQGYDNLLGCIDHITELITEYKQPTTLIDTVRTAVTNIRNNKELFNRAYSLRSEMPKILYNTMTLSTITSTTLLITTCVEFVKNPDSTFSESFDTVAYTKTKDHLLFKSLKEFNDMCARGEMQKVCNTFMKSNIDNIKKNENFMYFTEDGGAIAVAVAFVAGIVGVKIFFKLFVYVLRSSIYYFMFMRQNISDYFALQAEYLQVNIDNLDYKDMDSVSRNKIKTKQLKWVDRFKKISNAFMIDDKKASNGANQQEKEDSKNKPNQDDDNSDGGLF